MNDDRPAAAVRAKDFLREWWHRIFLPIDPPEEFQEPPADLARRLGTQDAEVADEILTHARELYEEPFLRAEGAERRATTLLGALAIATSFGLAGGGLLLDVDRIPAEAWRVALAIGYLILIIGLVGAAFRSLETLRVKTWSRPGDERIFEKAGRSLLEGRLRYAAELLNAAGRNRPVARWKVAQVRAAAWWLTVAVFALLAIAFSLALYVFLGPQAERVPSPKPTDSRKALVEDATQAPMRCQCWPRGWLLVTYEM